MSETKHTPPPWRAGIPGNPRVYAPDGNGKESGPIAEVLPCGDFARQAANKHLIAAAPDLLKVLQDVASEADRVFDERNILLQRIIFERVEAAIRKATEEA